MRGIILSTLAVIGLATGCHSNPPAPAPPPEPTEAELAMHRHMQDSLDAAARSTADSLEQARQLAMITKQRADSIEQARLAAEAELRDRTARSSALREELAMMVNFDVARSELSAESQAVLDRKVAILAGNPEVRLQITGATDERGSESYNMALGQRRAASVRKYLLGKGVDGDRLDLVSTGEASPLDTGDDQAAWARNRRAEFTIVGGSSPLALHE